jgi:hypothetical protein
MPNDTPYTYEELRKAIHKILYDFFDRELACSQDNEYNFEYMESTTDEILRIIRRQGGNV